MTTPGGQQTFTFFLFVLIIHDSLHQIINLVAFSDMMGMFATGTIHPYKTF
jgi:hypothetical protein